VNEILFQWQSKVVDPVDTSFLSFLYIIELVLALNIAAIVLDGR